MNWATNEGLKSAFLVTSPSMDDVNDTVSKTPILDSGTLPKPTKKSFATMAVGFLLAVPFSGVLIAVANDARQSRNAPVDYIFPIYLLSILLAIVIHELGHLVAGWFVGFRFSSISIGPICLRVEYGRLKVQVRKWLPAGGYAGMHIGRLRRLRHRLLVFTTGGPIANLLTAAVCASILVYSPPRSNGLTSSLDMLWMISAVLGLLNLIPFRVGALYNDGSRILMLRRSAVKARRWICQCAIANQTQDGIRPRMWKRTWLHSVVGVRDGSLDDFSGNWAAYISANDRKDSFEAAAYLERCLELTPKLGAAMVDFVAHEAAVFSAWFRQDPVASHKWRAQIKKIRSLPKLMQARGEIALCCARNEFGPALSMWQKAFASIENLPPTPVKSRLIEGFQEWREEILERERAPQAPVDSEMVPSQ